MHKPQFDGTPSTEEYRAYLALLLRDTFIGRAENLPLARATDRILAQDVLARLDVPSFDNSQMDGYALTAEGASRENRIFTVGREIPAGRPLQRSRASDDLTYPSLTRDPRTAGYTRRTGVYPRDGCLRAARAGVHRRRRDSPHPHRRR